MPIPRKIAGSEIKMIEPLITAMNTPKVVLVRAIHLYRSGCTSSNCDIESTRFSEN
jgi:hypothetical protein